MRRIPSAAHRPLVACAAAVVALALLAACGSGGDMTVVKVVTAAPAPAPTDTTGTIDKTPPPTVSVPPATVAVTHTELEAARVAPSRRVLGQTSEHSAAAS